MAYTGSLTELEDMIRSSWDADTCDPVDLPWAADNPAKGQCGVTALVLHDLLGGDLALATVDRQGERRGYHWWLRTAGGIEIDLTRAQFIEGETLGSPEYLERPPGRPNRCADQYLLLRSRVFERLGIPSNPTVVREGTEADVPGCVDIAAEIGLGEPDAWRETLLRTVRDGVDRVLFVAEVGSSIVGYGRAVHATAPADPEGWYLLGVAVSEAWRRRGIGEALTRARMEWVANRSDQIYYFTHEDNLASQALHERLGFVEMSTPFVPPASTPAFAKTQRLYVAQL